MMHIPKRIRSAILDLGKKGKKPLFSAGTQHTGHLEGWLYWWKAMASLHIGQGIFFSNLVLHYFRYKMAAEVCLYLWGSSWAHRQVGPYVLYIKMTVWVSRWCTSKKKIRSAILDFGKKGKKPLFSAVTLHTGHLEGWLYWWKAMV